MNRTGTCLTGQLAADLLLALETPKAASRWAATFEGVPLLRLVRGLAEQAGARGARMFVFMEGSDGLGAAYDLGHSAADVSINPVPRGAYPLSGRPPDEGTTLLVVFSGDGPLEATVRVSQFVDGEQHGFTPESPAVVLASAGEMHAGYAYRGSDVSDLLPGPARAAEGAMLEGVSAKLFPDPRHGEVARLVAGAEGRDEAVAISAGGLPGLHCIREPGADRYMLADDADLAARTAAWAAAGAAVVAVRHGFARDGRDCSLLRRVGGLVDGADADIPGACVSTLPADGGTPRVTTAFFRGGGRLEVTAPGVPPTMVVREPLGRF